MDKPVRRESFPFVPAGVVIDGDDAHLCVLADDGWPHYATVAARDPARWRRTLASLADSNTATIGRYRRAPLRKPLWLALESNGERPASDLLSLVLLPKGRLSLVPDEVAADYARRIACDPFCRFDRAELLAHYVLYCQPQWEDDAPFYAELAAG